VRSATGEERRARRLVSTLPIHDLLPIWADAPAAAHEAAARLRYNSLINVVIGTNEDRGYPYTAIYVPDPRIPFHRISFPCAFSERCAPPGSSVMMAEITANAGDGVWELDDQTLIERTSADLERMGLIDRSRISYRRVLRFRYGYPVYDLGYRQTVTAMRAAVAGAGIRLLGRFAEFDYINSDVCVERALRAAAELRA
jgi:protoporphyrinogen oxidase